MPAPKRLLILGGTAEARALAKACARRLKDRMETISSLAGRTGAPLPLAGRSRRGGFGGATGLADYLRGEAIELVVDATHPFATRISANARIACGEAKVPRLQIVRPAWRLRGLRSVEVASTSAAAKLLPKLGRRVFLTVGRGGLAAFAKVEGAWFLVRLLEPAVAPLRLPAHRVVVGRPPFSLAHEKRLMAKHRIDVLVTKASGGPSTRAKILAARDLKIPMIVVRRPPPEPGATVATVAAALAWIEDRLEAKAR